MKRINNKVVNGFSEIVVAPFYIPVLPKQAALSSTSLALKAPWTNRAPDHEPWPRVLKVDDQINTQSDQYKRNVHHIDQYDNVTSPDGRLPIGKVEGDENIDRGTFWRR